MALKIKKDQVKVGQKMVIDKEHYLEENCPLIQTKEFYEKYKKGTNCTVLEVGDIVEILTPVYPNSVLWFRHKNVDYMTYWSEIKKCTTLGDFENISEEVIQEYTILYDKTPWKRNKKYKTINTAKNALLIAMNYYLQLMLLRDNSDLTNCPELNEVGVLDCIQYDGIRIYTREEFEKFEIVNIKTGEKLDFDPVQFYDRMMEKMELTVNYGSAVAKLALDINIDKYEYKYILCFVHEGYKKFDYPDYEYLRESKTIKTILKKNKYKGKKTTLYGKTAIAFINEEEMNNVIADIDTDLNSYYIYECI